jgi:hypothetical protein
MFIRKKQHLSNWIRFTTNVIKKKSSKINDDIKPKSPNNLKRYMKKEEGCEKHKLS